MSKYVCTKCEYLNAALKIFESIKLSDNCLDNLTIWIGASKRDKTSIETRNLYACVFHKLDINVLDCDFEAILDGRKAIELRKRIGELFVENTKIFIYSSSPVKAIVAEAKISCIQKKAPSDVEIDLLEKEWKFAKNNNEAYKPPIEYIWNEYEEESEIIKLLLKEKYLIRWMFIL